MTVEEKVHDTIMAILSTAQVPQVKFADSRGSAFVAMTVDDVNTVTPTQAEANITQYVMAEHPQRLNPSYRSQVGHTVWQAYIAYPKQVAVESLLESFSRTVAADGAQRQFDLRLISVDAEAPPRNDPKNGTFLTLIIEAHPAPAL